MSQYLATGEFENLSFPKNYLLPEIEELLHLPDDNECGFLIDCDLLYPAEIKQITENFPLCPYQVETNCELVPDYMNFIKQPNYKPTQKLVSDLTNEQKCMMHYRKLKFYLSQGMKVTEIQSVYRFKQLPWSAKYIDHST